MKIALGSDHAGYEVKERIAGALGDAGHEILNAGTNSEESVDYPDYAHKVAAAVAGGEVDMGVLICGTGIGMCMAANRHRGVRAAVVHDEFTAEMSRRHNNANVLCMGARVLTVEKAVKLALEWTQYPYDGDRHQRRIEKIEPA